jgi:hypothetical protein
LLLYGGNLNKLIKIRFGDKKVEGYGAREGSEK